MENNSKEFIKNKIIVLNKNLKRAELKNKFYKHSLGVDTILCIIYMCFIFIGIYDVTKNITLAALSSWFTLYLFFCVIQYHILMGSNNIKEIDKLKKEIIEWSKK